MTRETGLKILAEMREIYEKQRADLQLRQADSLFRLQRELEFIYGGPLFPCDGGVK